MRLFLMIAGQARTRLVQAGAVIAAAALIAGCGNSYRPVVTPINPSGPPAQPASYAVVVSSPSPTAPGVATIIDYAGDTIMAAAPIGPGPAAFTIDQLGSAGYTVNSDGTLTNFPVSTSLQAKFVTYTTLSTAAKPVNLYSPAIGLWATDLNGNIVDVFTGSPATFKLAIPVAPTPISIVGTGSNAGQRNYVISQNFDDTTTGVACNTSPTTAPIGVATPIETSSFSPDIPIPLGKCPVYTLMNNDTRRLFVLNRGDDTITLDACTPFLNQNGQLVTCHPSLPLSTAAGLTGPNVPAIAGPVYAEYNSATNQLVVANYDGGTISVIDVSLDQYGNDSQTFGTTYTVPVGKNPASVTVLLDGSRAYTANQADGTVTVVNLTSHAVEKTLSVVGHPRTVVSTQNSQFSKVYVASPDSPYLTILSTSATASDVVDTTILVQGNIVDVRATSQDGNRGNANGTSRTPGHGQPCYLPLTPAQLALTPSLCSKMP
jgi:YVTN family beta-propeller protein